ncbi:MAG: MFS transporter [Microthrixaceae bacterium]|nr:MFS transporter [Microthrixaceae bacterium]
MTESSSFAPLRHRAYRLVWTGSLVSNVGTWMQAAALGYYTAHTTQSAAWSAVVAAGEFAPTALLGPFGGAIADRFPRRTVFLTCTVVQGLLAAALTWGMVAGEPGAPVLALFALANGCVFALGFPAFSAILPELVPSEIIGAAIGLSSAAWNLGRVVGPLLGTILYQEFGIAWVLGINAASFLAVVLVLVTLRLAPQPRSSAPMLAAIRQGFAYVRSQPGLRVTSQALCLNSLFIAPFIGLIPAMVEKELGGGKRAVGWLITGQGIGAVVAGVVFGRLSGRFGVRRVMVWAIVLGSLALVGYGFSPNWPVAFAALLVCGGCYFAALASFSTVANLLAPSELRGRVLSLNQVVLGTVYAISLNVEGQLGDRLGLREVTIGGALLCLVVVVVVRIAHPGYTAVLDETGGVRHAPDHE